jgi:putative transposase
VARQNGDLLLNQVHALCTALFCLGCKPGCMLCLLRLLLVLVTRFSCSRRDLLLENLALRQQLITLKRKHPRSRVAVSDKLFWVLLRRFWPEWKQVLIFVQPETVVRWHRAGFKVYWEWLSRHRTRAGRKCVSIELRELTFRMVAENPTWGAPRIHGELRMLGFDISERTVLRWMRKAPRSPEPAKRWATFLSNHREAIAAMDFFTVPTLTFGVLYCFFVIAHDRRRILGCSVTKHPTSAWVIQQLREAFPYDSFPGYLIFDRATNFNKEVIDTVKSFGIQPKRTSFRSPWQNGVAERWIGNCRRDLIDHVIVVNERHLKRLMNEYVRYYHEDRTHLALEKSTPAGRHGAKNPDAGSRVVSMPRLGGLHHRYDLTA